MSKTATISETLGVVPEVSPEQIAPETESNAAPKAKESDSKGEDGFSLRKAIIAQTILERKY